MKLYIYIISITTSIFMSNGFSQESKENLSNNKMILKKISDDSFYDIIGLKDGDEIKKINGKFLHTPEESIILLNSLKNESGIEIVVVRNGKEETIKIKLNQKNSK